MSFSQKLPKNTHKKAFFSNRSTFLTQNVLSAQINVSIMYKNHYLHTFVTVISIRFQAKSLYSELFDRFLAELSAK